MFNRRNHKALFAHRQQGIKQRFIKFLAKTGNKAAQREIHKNDGLVKAATATIANFGTPSTIVLSPEALEDFKKIIGEEEEE